MLNSICVSRPEDRQEYNDKSRQEIIEKNKVSMIEKLERWIPELEQLLTQRKLQIILTKNLSSY